MTCWISMPAFGTRSTTLYVAGSMTHTSLLLVSGTSISDRARRATGLRSPGPSAAYTFPGSVGGGMPGSRWAGAGPAAGAVRVPVAAGDAARDARPDAAG